MSPLLAVWPQSGSAGSTPSGYDALKIQDLVLIILHSSLAFLPRIASKSTPTAVPSSSDNCSSPLLPAAVPPGTQALFLMLLHLERSKCRPSCLSPSLGPSTPARTGPTCSSYPPPCLPPPSHDSPPSACSPILSIFSLVPPLDTAVAAGQVTDQAARKLSPQES